MKSCFCTPDGKSKVCSFSNPVAGESGLDRFACGVGGKIVFPLVHRTIPIMLKNGVYAILAYPFSCILVFLRRLCLYTVPVVCLSDTHFFARIICIHKHLLPNESSRYKKGT